MSDKDLLEVKDVSKDVSGKYVCMATNCVDRSVRSNVSNCTDTYSPNCRANFLKTNATNLDYQVKVSNPQIQICFATLSTRCINQHDYSSFYNSCQSNLLGDDVHPNYAMPHPNTSLGGKINVEKVNFCGKSQNFS